VISATMVVSTLLLGRDLEKYAPRAAPVGEERTSGA
jgi:hypothetical protein